MRVYQSPRKVKQLVENARKRGYDRLFIQLNRTIPELNLPKGSIVEADEYDAARQTYTLYTGYGSVKIWKSSCREIM